MSSMTETHRSLPLSGAFNLRDFGGYATADGRHVRRGLLYRSGTMALLTDEDAAHLRSLGIRAICDFRRPSERTSEPTLWHEAHVDYFCRDYSGSSGVLADMIREGRATAEDMRRSMVHLYSEILIDHADSYRAMFAQMAGGSLPILINCSAGKDRTGAGAALVLAALGVPRETIVEDYLLTNVHADWEWLFAQRPTQLSRMREDMADIIAPVLTADIAYIEMLFDRLDTVHGGIDRYLEEVLGVDAAARAAVREALLEG